MPADPDRSPLVPGPNRRDPDALTPRERACLAAYAELWSYQAVADRLGIAVLTVAKHLANARSKLGASKTAEAITLAESST